MKYCHLGTVHTETQRAEDCNMGSLRACCKARLEMIVEHHPESVTREFARIEIDDRRAAVAKDHSQR